MSVKILLADDHKIVRDGLRALLERQPGYEVAGEAENGRAILRLARETPADVVIMDVGMPDLNGIDATRQLKSSVPEIRVIALSMHSDKRFVSEMFRAGASGYMLKDSAFEELSRALDVVLGGQIYLSPEITGSIIQDYVSQSTTEDTSPFAVLSPREREVFQLLAEGKPSKQIATQLGVSVKTVDTHRQQIMQKLNVRSLADLIKVAIREGLTSLELSRD